MDPSFLKIKRLLHEIIRLGDLDHGVQEKAFAVFALELTPGSRDRDGGVAAAQVFIADHAREVESDLRPVVCPGLSKCLFKETLIFRTHWVCPRKVQSLGLTVPLLGKYPGLLQRQKRGDKRPWPEKID
jgi:hypothetical protein